MSGAPFHQLLPGVGPPTATRLHDRGITTWDELADVLDVVTRIRDLDAATLRRLRDQARQRAREDLAASAETSSQTAPTGPISPTDNDVVGERSHSFVLKVAVLADGRPARTSVTDVRSGRTRTSPGLAMADVASALAETLETDCRQIVAHPLDLGRGGRHRPVRFNTELGTVEVTDSGHTVWWDTGALNLPPSPTNPSLAYRALLTARGSRPMSQVRLQVVDAIRGRARPGELVELAFATHRLEPGLHRLALTMEVRTS